MVFAFFIITGMVAFVSEQYPGTRHDFIIFRESVAKYREFLEKRVDEEDFDDPEQSQAHWALLADKGYTGAEAYLMALIPKNLRPCELSLLNILPITKDCQVRGLSARIFTAAWKASLRYAQTGSRVKGAFIDI
jgi:hypothetical protein